MHRRYDRQSFLGEKAQAIFAKVKVAVIGLGGGGSHVCQQLAHIGFSNYVIIDPDVMKDVNLNRTVGATLEDVKNEVPKVNIAKRTILGLQPSANIEIHRKKWQEAVDSLKDCDLVLGCIDGFINRRDIEGVARRYLIPYIDIGMDVHQAGNDPPRIAGQVILSMPGYACMQCMRFLTEANLTKEGMAYGVAGTHPQVVWCNGVLASTAVGLAIDLLTDWSGSLRRPVHLSYDGNLGTIQADARMHYISMDSCPHYPPSGLGDPKFEEI